VRRALRDPRWLAGLAVAVVFALVCVWLAQWQLDRRVARAERNTAVLVNFDSQPLPLGQVVQDPRAALAPTEQWQPVALSGRYDVDSTVLVRNRTQNGSNGFLVATPFEPDDAGAPVSSLLLVRGWVPSGDEAGVPASLPDAPPGSVEVVARLRSAEPSSRRDAPQGQTYRLDAPLLRDAAGAGAPLEAAYGVVATEAGDRPTGLDPVPRPDTDPGPHLAYGVQWYLFALAGLTIWVVLARRHAGEHGSGHGGPSDPAGLDGTGEGAGGKVGDRTGWVYEPGR